MIYLHYRASPKLCVFQFINATTMILSHVFDPSHMVIDLLNAIA